MFCKEKQNNENLRKCCEEVSSRTLCRVSSRRL